MTCPQRLHVVFIHLDLGIGGAEQLVLQLAQASHDLHHKVDIVTTRCDPTHCFASVAPPNGVLYKNLHVWGQWIPHDIFGHGRALCSTVRLLYLAYRVARKKSPNLIVLDVLSTPLPLLRLTDAALLFYCHFPDQLLTRNNNNDEPNVLQRIYRSVLDKVEEITMSCADMCVVNSQFTREIVQSTFPLLRGGGRHQDDLPVLYPALDTAALDAHQTLPKRNCIVSLNRYERKKNLGLLIEACAWIQQQQQQQQEEDNKNVVDGRRHCHPLPLPDIVIAGGYDPRNVENVEYRAELEQLARYHNIAVDFQTSISDKQRSMLLQTALCLVYTPRLEHFGIVPLEAMYLGTPVVAVNSGGPLETIVHGVTGYLCDNHPSAFGAALEGLMQDPQQAHAMGQAGRQHVQAHFGSDHLMRSWDELTKQTLQRGRQRLMAAGQYRWARIGVYVLEAFVTLLLAFILTWMLRQLNVLEPSESIWSAARKALRRDEL